MRLSSQTLPSKRSHRGGDVDWPLAPFVRAVVWSRCVCSGELLLQAHASLPDAAEVPLICARDRSSVVAAAAAAGPRSNASASSAAGGCSRSRDARAPAEGAS